MNQQLFDYTFHTPAGQAILVRSLMKADTKHLVDIFEHMTAESRYRRFHQSLDNVSEKRIWHEADLITQMEPRLQHGLIAFAESEKGKLSPVGAARLVRLNHDEAEVAISIRDDFQDMGIGSYMMRRLAGEARTEGYQRLLAEIQNENKAIGRVFEKLPYPVERSSVGTNSTITVYLRENP